MRYAWSMFVLSTLAACGGGEPPLPPPSGVIQIGGGAADGTEGFVELSDGQDLTLVPGAQGGFHVYLNVRVEAQSMNPDAALYLFRTARREDTNQLVSMNQQLSTFVPSTKEGYFETERSMLLFLCPAPAEIQVFDQPLVLNVEARNHHKDPDPIAAGTISLTPHCPEGEQNAFCAEICSGN